MSGIVSERESEKFRVGVRYIEGRKVRLMVLADCESEKLADEWAKEWEKLNRENFIKYHPAAKNISVVIQRIWSRREVRELTSWAID